MEVWEGKSTYLKIIKKYSNNSIMTKKQIFLNGTKIKD